MFAERKPAIRFADIRSFFTGLILLFVLAHFFHHLMMALLQPLLPFIRDDFAFDYTQAGWVMSAFALAYGLGQLPAGWLADRIGRRVLVFIGISGVAVCGLAIGLTLNYVMLLVFLVTLGLLGGGYHPASVPLISASVAERYRGRALGIHQIGGTASFFLTPLIAAGIAALIGWRGSFMALSIPIAIFGLLMYLLLGRRGHTRSMVDVPDAESYKASSAPRRWRQLITVLILGVSVQVSIFTIISFVPLFAVDQLNVTNEAGAALLSLVHFTGLWAGLLGGYLSDRLGKVPILLATCLVTGPAIYALSLVSVGWSLPLVLIIIGICIYVSMPVSESYIITQTPERYRSTLLGIYYSVSRGGSGFITPAMGYFIDRYGFAASFTVLGASMLALTVVCSTFLRKSHD